MKDSTAKLPSNQYFLSTIFGNDWKTSHVTSFTDDPSNIDPKRRGLCWAGRYAGRGELSEGNQYFTISRFKPLKGKAVRQKSQFIATYVIVADDVVEKLPLAQVKKLPPPSYKLLTSAKSEQWGWFLYEPCHDRDKVDNLLDGLVKLGLSPDGIDPGMRGVTRYVRLPGGHNAKKSRLIDGKPFDCKLLEFWQFDSFTMEQLAEPFGIDLYAKRKETVDGAADVNHPILDVVYVKGEKASGKVDITCPWMDSHSDEQDDGAMVFTNEDLTIGFKCHHGSCDDKNGKSLLDWIEEENPGWNARFEVWKIHGFLGSLKSFDDIEAPEPILDESLSKSTEEKARNDVSEYHQKLNAADFPHTEVSKKGFVSLPDTVANTRYLLKEYGVTVEWDQIKKESVYFVPNDDSTNSADALETVIGLVRLNKLPQTNTVNRMTTTAHKNPLNRVVEYLKTLDYKGNGSIQQLAEHIIVENGTEHIRNQVFKMWMIMACAAADHAESTPNKEAIAKFDSVMIFFGEQGLKKTQFFRAMLPKPLRQYFSDGVLIDPTDKDSVSQCIRWWIVEAGEVDGLFKKIDITRFKQFFSRSTDTFRKPYERSEREFERRTVFVASTNEREFLKDYTGNRRYWPLAVEEITIPTDENVINNAWAEAWQYYTDGKQWWPDVELTNSLSSQTRSFQAPISNEPVEEAIRDLIEKKYGKFAHDVLRPIDMRNALTHRGMNEYNLDKTPTLNIIGKIMKQHNLGIHVKTAQGAYWIIRNFNEYKKMKNSDIEKYYNSAVKAPPVIPNQTSI